MNWPIEIIPNKDFLYRRVHNNLLLISRNFDEIPPYAFKDNNGISTEWNKYSTPEETRQRALDPKKNGVIKIKVEIIRQFQNFSVNHAPIPLNRAHSNINGLKTYKKEDQTDIRKRLSRAAEWIIKASLTI
jgi:hypothetical protein